jgi:ribulose bisphosphate carboxylase small subunit
MNIIASYRPVNAQYRKNVYHTRISNIVKNALKKNKRISIISSEHSNRPPFNNFDNNAIHYACYDTEINNMYDELANEILSDIESCVYDYPDAYISILTVDDANSVKNTESFLIHSPE